MISEMMGPVKTFVAVLVPLPIKVMLLTVMENAVTAEGFGAAALKMPAVAAVTLIIPSAITSRLKLLNNTFVKALTRV